MLRLEKRPSPSRTWAYLAPVLAVIATMIGGGVMFALLGKDPFEAIRIIFYDPLFSEFAWYYRPQLLIKGAPLILIAIGLSMGFRAGIWNIGAEGQYIIGALFGAGFALALYPTESPFIFPSMIVLGALGGFLWAMIPAVLKTKFGTNEILVSLMLVYVAEQLLASMSLGLMKNPEGFGFPGSRNLQQYASAHNAELWVGSGVHMGVVFALMAIIFRICHACSTPTRVSYPTNRRKPKSGSFCWGQSKQTNNFLPGLQWRFGGARRNVRNCRAKWTGKYSF